MVYLTLVAKIEPLACRVPLTSTFVPLFKSAQVNGGTNVVELLVTTVNPFTPKVTDGHVP